jgi:hypothetical protein
VRSLQGAVQAHAFAVWDCFEKALQKLSIAVLWQQLLLRFMEATKPA